jgi:DNA-binding CsgD family transcriptional regulator
MKKRNTKVPLIPGTKYPEPEVTGGWEEEGPDYNSGGAEAPATVLIVHGLNDPDAEYRREVRHGTAFDLFTTLGVEHERRCQAVRKVIDPAIAKVRETSSTRRKEMARRLRRGQTIKEVAADMHASRNTVAAVKRTLR